jgi:hydrogenase maturation factor
VLGVTVELTLVVQCVVEVTFKEGGGSWWISCVDFARSLAQPTTTISFHTVLYFVTFKVVNHCILGINEIVDVSHEVGNGISADFVDLLEELDVGDYLLVVGYHIFILDTDEGVVVLEEMVGVLSENFTFSHLHFGEVVSVAGAVVGRLVVHGEELR